MTRTPHSVDYITVDMTPEQRIEHLIHAAGELQDLIATLVASIGELQDRVEELESEVEDLT